MPALCGIRSGQEQKYSPENTVRNTGRSRNMVEVRNTVVICWHTVHISNTVFMSGNFLNRKTCTNCRRGTPGTLADVMPWCARRHTCSISSASVPPLGGRGIKGAMGNRTGGDRDPGLPSSKLMCKLPHSSSVCTCLILCEICCGGWFLASLFFLTV